MTSTDTSNDYLFDEFGRYRRERFTPAPPAPRAGIVLDDELTDEQYEIADRIELWLEAHPGKLYNRSTIARGVKAGHAEVTTILAWLDRNRMVVADGNGCWRKYGVR
jgi:hypothetical protein